MLGPSLLILGQSWAGLGWVELARICFVLGRIWARGGSGARPGRSLQAAALFSFYTRRFFTPEDLGTRDDLHPSPRDFYTKKHLHNLLLADPSLGCKRAVLSNFCTTRLAHQERFTPNSFSLRFWRQRHVASGAPCHFFTRGFVHETFLPQKTSAAFYTEEPLHKSPVTPETLCIRGTLQQKLFTPKNICNRNCLHQTILLPTRLENKRLTWNNLYTERLERQEPFDHTALISPHRMSESFYTKKLLDQNHAHTLTKTKASSAEGMKEDVPFY